MVGFSGRDSQLGRSMNSRENNAGELFDYRIFSVIPTHELLMGGVRLKTHIQLRPSIGLLLRVNYNLSLIPQNIRGFTH
jgi:hypothetical protein